MRMVRAGEMPSAAAQPAARWSQTAWAAAACASAWSPRRRCRRDAVNMAVRRLSSILVGKARRLVRDLKAIVLGSALRGTHAANLPIVLGHKRHALALALDHQGKRRRLHAAGGAHVTKAAKLGERQVARQHRTPNEVDVLTALAGVGQVLVERDKVIEGLRDLGLGKRRILGAGDRQVGRTSRTLLRRPNRSARPRDRSPWQ